MKTISYRIWSRLLLACLGFAVSGSIWAAEESPTKFCWKETWVTDASKTVIPDRCGPDQERNGLFCYEKCRDDYTSNRVDGCVQNCPPGATDDGLFCGWPSYKAAEYPLWDEQRCKDRHATGCWKSGALWVEKCKPGYKHVLGFCEKKDINCQAMGLKGKRVANSCAKNFYTRPPRQAGCPAGTEFSAGLCYAQCGATADRVGFVCWGKCPAGWVNCGMGCAKDTSACHDAITDQVVSVLDAVASTTVMIGTMGASAAGKNIISKAAWKGIKKIGKTAAKDVLKSVAVSTALQTPGNIGKIVNGTMDYVWNVGAIMDNNVMTEVEKQHAIAQLALDSASLFDPTGVTGVVSAYAKPLCKDIAAAHPAAPAGTTASAGGTASVTASLQSLSHQGQTLNTRLQRDKEAEIKTLKEQLAKSGDPATKKGLETHLSSARADLKRIKRDLANAKAMTAKAANYRNLGNAAPAAASAAGPKWLNGSPMPANAVVGGRHRNGAAMQVCRADMGDGLHPGKVWGGKCNIGWGGVEKAMTRFQVLVANPDAVTWVRVRDGRIPANAIVGGRHTNGSDIQVCRADMGDGLHPGKVWGGKCHIGWSGKEKVSDNFEVLTLKQ